MSTDRSAIVRWTTNRVAGTTVRYGVVHFGADPRRLNQVAKSQNRWNTGLPTMTYRVSVDNLEPGQTYYYSVEFTNANGVSEGADSAVHQFTTQRRP
jgi:phosphodiesterase/alkaline phosphatase D-like protein